MIMIHDRGRIKWVSMMLPEHVRILREWAQEDRYETRKELDEQQLELLDEIISEAMEFDRAVSIIHYHHKQYALFVGHIHRCDPLNGQLYVVDHSREAHQIDLQNIRDIRWSDD
jgi:hypothetical protein